MTTEIARWAVVAIMLPNVCAAIASGFATFALAVDQHEDTAKAFCFFLVAAFNAGVLFVGLALA